MTPTSLCQLFTQYKHGECSSGASLREHPAWLITHILPALGLGVKRVCQGSRGATSVTTLSIPDNEGEMLLQVGAALSQGSYCREQRSCWPLESREK